MIVGGGLSGLGHASGLFGAKTSKNADSQAETYFGVLQFDCSNDIQAEILGHARPPRCQLSIDHRFSSGVFCFEHDDLQVHETVNLRCSGSGR